MIVLVTGGSGFLGRQIVRLAREEGHDVFAPRSAEMNLETGEGIDETFGRIKADAGKIDAIVHSAAYYGGLGITKAEPATILSRNCRMGVNIFDAALKHDVRKVIPIGSACSYPGYLQGDLKEENFWDGPLHDSVEGYGFVKKLLLVAQHAYHRQHGVESNHLVLTNLYGEHDVFTEYRSHVVSALIKKFVDADDKVTLWGDGSPVREFLYVEDAADAIVRTIPTAHDPEPINIGTGVGTSIRELAEAIQDISGFAGEIVWDTDKPNGVPRKVLDVSRMKEKLGWSPRYSLREGLEKTIAWYQANRETASART